jgi:hypothetical protein
MMFIRVKPAFALYFAAIALAAPQLPALNSGLVPSEAGLALDKPLRPQLEKPPRPQLEELRTSYLILCPLSTGLTRPT